MNLPRSLRVLGQKVTVKRYAKLEMDLHGQTLDLSGSFNGEIREVAIANTGMSPEREREVLLHEAVHGMLTIGRFGMEHDAEEEFVGRFSTILLDFIRANPQAVAYLQEVV